MEAKEPVVLALETSIGDGSLALLRGCDVIAERSTKIGRADHVLIAIESILETANMMIREIDKLAVSTGPGSFTGVRIGISTVLGLQRALSIEAVGVTIFRAVAHSVSDGKVIAAIVPIGRGRLGCQIFRRSEPDQGEEAPFSIAETEIPTFLRKVPDVERVVFVGSESQDRVVDIKQNGNVVEVVDDTKLAALIGKLAANGKAGGALDPLYLR